MDTGWNVLKWVLIVLATGFVGYVGRFGAQWLIERARARHQAEPPGRQQHPPDGTATGSEPTDDRKAEKKRAKADAKTAKKEAKTR